MSIVVRYSKLMRSRSNVPYRFGCEGHRVEKERDMWFWPKLVFFSLDDQTLSFVYTQNFITIKKLFSIDMFWCFYNYKKGERFPWSFVKLRRGQIFQFFQPFKLTSN